MLTSAGFSVEYIANQKKKKREELEDAGFSDEEIDKYFCNEIIRNKRFDFVVDLNNEFIFVLTPWTRIFA